MGLHPIDGYLLDGVPGKSAAVAAILADRSAAPPAQPFYRALEALGANVADEALIALRIATLGKTPDDDGIRAFRSQIVAARGGDPAARAAYLAAVETS